MDDTRSCTCGSGLRRQPQYDARGIFLTYTCQQCHQSRMSRYRRDVLRDPNYLCDEPIEED